MPTIQFVAAHRPDRSPSQRYRFEQYLPYWERNGFAVDYAALLNERDDRLFYAPGAWLPKAGLLARAWMTRRSHVQRASTADLIFIQREAFMTGSVRFERALARTGKPVIFDFDDAIWLLDVSEANKRLSWLKDPSKTARIIQMADLVIAGNEYLANYARRFHQRVEVIPTVVDTERYRHTIERSSTQLPVTIGWTGSYTSLTHLRAAIPMLQQLHQRLGDRVRFRIISDRDLLVPGLPIENVRWSSATEAADLAAMDIGIMPMPDDEWSKGKCGFKGLQYMAMGKPVVLSAVGVNNTIVQDGFNGFLAASTEEWLMKLEKLVNDSELRARLGAQARLTVEQHYSVNAWKDRYLQLFNELLNATPRS
ncbi:MAG: glycosyltransferase family 4 protein [Flavobacteriales bacterium]|nr:glycosyltransferase family 4 protein [Flavobacteriales bacterium]